MHKYIFILLVFVSAFSVAQTYKIDVTLPAAAGKEMKLAYHYLGNIYIKDTTMLDNKGFGTFAGDSLLPQGLYKIYFDDQNHFDFLIGADQQFSIRNETFFAENAIIEGADETREFIKYVGFLKDLQNRSAEIRQQIQTATAENRKALETEMNSLTPKLHQYWFDIKQKYPETILSAFLLANYVPQLDIQTLPAEIRSNDSLLLIARFNYQKDHYWDYFDYTDERLLFTPLYKPKLETWFNQILYQNYDSVKTPVFEFIENTRSKRRVFQFVASWFINTSVNSHIMGMDALFVDLARKYYLSGEAFWADAETIEKIKENVMFAENNLIGMQAPNLTLEKIDGSYANLYEIQQKYTIVVIYEPNCSHCMEFVPELYERVYLPFRSKGLEVFAIYSMADKKEWTDFLTEHDFHDWINVWDEHHVSNFKILYDARTTPGVFLLDRNKKIIAKKVTVDYLVKFMEENAN